MYNNMNGIIFDIKEFSVYDGPGVRATVFLKGCPLRCLWCHNPEGLETRPQIMVSSGCQNCGKCHVDGCILQTDGNCNGCGRCADLCPQGLRRIVGREVSSDDLLKQLKSYAPFFGKDGGVTFSGGEPTYQPEFLCEMLEKLGNAGIHRAVQTCGYCSESVFERVLERTDFFLFDIKHPDGAVHKTLTGVDNSPILKNLQILKSSGKPFIARIPLIDGINDDDKSLTQTAELLKGESGLIRVELLPYNGAAGAKYKMIGKPYPHDFKAPSKINTAPFTQAGIEVKIL